MVTSELVTLDALEQDALAVLDRLERALAASEGFNEVIEIRDAAERAEVLARLQGLSKAAARFSVVVRRAEIKWARITPKLPGKRTDLEPVESIPEVREPNADLGKAFRAAAAIPDEVLDQLTAAAVEAETPLTRKAVITEAKRIEVKAAVAEIEANPPPPLPEGQYSTVVVNPPWPMAKIETDHRPRPVEFDYPTLPLADIAGLSVGDMLADDAFVFLWTTTKFLPDAFRILEGWGVKCRFLMVWHKPGGFQPFNMPQLNGEFVVGGRRAIRSFGMRRRSTRFSMRPRAGHSVKPDEFYDLLRRVTPEPRLDMFSRREIAGFDGWG